MKEKNTLSSEQIDGLVNQAVFGANDMIRSQTRGKIFQLAHSEGVYPASIQGFYEARGKGLFEGITVPAINIRGITYHVARAVFRAAIKEGVGAVIFEIARSELGYTAQSPEEYSACVQAAAVREGFSGPVFIQGDHYQVRQKNFNIDEKLEFDSLRELIRQSIAAGFYNIDIDASTIVNLNKPTLLDQQEENCRTTAGLTEFIRSNEPQGVTVSIGGEIGEVGKQNSTVEELDAFMTGYQARLAPGIKGISKISVQTGTAHGGVVLADGSVANVKIDFDTLKKLSAAARERYGMGGAVQHGASTLPDDAFHMFPEVGTLEIHLATGFQNIIYSSPYFPRELTEKIDEHLLENYASERKEGDTEEQFLYKTRKKAFGDFKEEIWGIPQKNLANIMEELEERFLFLFKQLNAGGTIDLVDKYITAPPSI